MGSITRDRRKSSLGFGVKFIGLYGTVGFIAIPDFSLLGESDLWSAAFPFFQKEQKEE